MASKPNSTRKKNNEKEKNDTTVLIRDDTTQILMLGDASKVLSIKKGVKLADGVIVSWQDNNRQRWRGPILAIG